MESCYVLFGSNMGDKENIFAEACLLINNRCGAITAVSSSYESEPWGFEASEWFLNRLIVVDTDLNPEAMLRELLAIEAELGRVRHPEKEGYTSRTADLDILYFGQRVIVTPILTVPHPRLHLRRFALMPLCEVAPELMHPVFQVTQRELLHRCTDQSIVRVMQ
ncbi:MAG: 2-amino-4-hydroxy-6-hydroxymethyldihydropteridine diphosphokinase [Bacteroidales bacterium]|nr:2-amino-4-hydroxy-6-hydroxymethyldihydropteridine diphosphokinase [Bacteroidales bacterium]MBR6878300.1 2-amino-4-hydroxy-6-hydroxymethyldihydropteridine diphosphokinase [Bacteroidales bacterium]